MVTWGVVIVANPMSSRRIARELAVILLPQLPKDKKKLEKLELDSLVDKAVQMLTDYAKQCLHEADGFVVKAKQELLEQTIDHPDNEIKVHDVRPVTLKSEQVQQHLDLMERALHLTAEALDIPTLVIEKKDTTFLHELVGAFVEHKDEVDGFISQVKEKWRLERMISIDRDIIRLACTEAFFLKNVPINVCISEAVELSHRFADERAAKFINGVLADLAEQAKHYRQTGQFPTGEAASSEIRT